MPRVTRSQRVNISEDQTAFTMHHLVPTQMPALVELAGNSIPQDDEAMAIEIEKLKVKYHRLTPPTQSTPKPTRKPRSKKESSSTVSISNASSNAPQVKGSDGSLIVRLNDLTLDETEHPPPYQVANKRMTRSQTETLVVEAQRDDGIAVASPPLERNISYSGPAFRDYRSITTTTVASEESDTRQDHPAEKALDNFLGSKQNEDEPCRNLNQTPAKQTITLEEVESRYHDEMRRRSAPPAVDSDDDSFVGVITSRSPAKPVSRIEDSVEALDELEEAMDAVAASAQIIQSAEEEESIASGVISENNKTKQRNVKPGFSTVRSKPTVPRTSVLRKTTSMILRGSVNETDHSAEDTRKAPEQRRTTAKRPTSLAAANPPAKSTKPVTVPAFELPGEAVAKRLREQREARQAQREAAEANAKKAAKSHTMPRTRSTKPPTKPTFELPGEAISRRKREAHEARLKAQEEEERKRREFKATPNRTSTQPNVVPRDTVASRARQSKAGAEIESGKLTTGKQGTNVGSHRPSITELIRANTSSPRGRGPAAIFSRKSATAAGPSMTGMVQRSISASDAQIQRQRAREIYSRDQKLTEDIEREKREREAAAKLAREAAAERGRQASREWAEKHRARKAAAGDVDLRAGYGPGGQMGL